MAENTTDETVDYNSEGDNQGTTTPQQSRTGYSTVGELQKANYYNSIKKTPASLRPLFQAAMAGKLPVQQEQAKQTVKPAFSMKDVEAGAMAEIKPKVSTTSVQKPSIKPLIEKQEGPKLQKSKSNIDTYNDVLIAVDNQSKLYESQLPSDMPMKDIFVEQKKQDFLSRVKKGELRVSKDDKGFPVLKNVIDGVISNFIDGYQSTLNANSQVNEFDVMDKDEQISYMKGSRLKPMNTIGETGKPTKVRYIEEPINKDLNTIQTERRGIGAETSMMMGGVVPDIATGMVVQALPGIGQFLSPAVVGAVQGRRQQFDSMNQAFQTAKQRGLSDEDAYEVANNFWNSKVSLITGVAEGVVSQYLGNKILHKFAEAKPAADLKSFGQAAKAFLKDAASNSKDLALSGSLDGAVAYSMEKVRGGSDDSAEEQFKAEFLTQLGFAAVGGAVSVPKYVKSYAYNAISNLDNQTIYNNMVSMEQAGAVPEGTAKKVVEDIDKFRETKNKVTASNPDAISTVAGLTMKAEAIQEQIKNTSPANTNALTALNTELEQVNQRINKAQSSTDPLSEEVDDKTGLNIKNKQNATTVSQGQEVPTTSGVSQYQRTEGKQAPQTNEANNSYSAFGSQTQQQKIILNAQNAADAKIDRPKSLIDGLINSASNVISALKSISPNLNVLVIPTAEEYGNTLVQQELDNGESVSKQREKDLRGSNGAVNQEGDTIYINAENIAKKGKTSTIFHEGAHPIINAIVSNNPEALNTLYDQLSGLQGEIDGVDRVLAFGGGYSNYGIDVVQSEAIVEFIARVADGQIKLPVDNPTVMKNILDVIKGFLEIIGFPVDIQSIDDIQSIAAKIKEGFQTGREIVLSNTTGSATEAGITSDAIVINAASITPTERGVDKSGLNLELTERNFDVNKIKYIDMADIDGANAFIFAADKAVSGLVKSPSGYVHEFNGGVTYSYQDGTGVWAFTSLDAANKFMNKVKTTDGVGLIMSQASSGIRGSYDFYTYMLGELNNAIEKGVSEKDLVTFLDSKLDIKVGDKSIREELANKGGKTTITSLADLDKLMPIDGPNLISYEYRGEFVQKSLSAFAEKNFGIPRFEKILEYANEPLITSAEYGDIVAAIQIDKNSPVIDTRKDNRFKNHTSYPFVVTGTPIGIFNNFYDVRKIAPNFVPVSGNQTPLAAREKPQAARSAMGGQPLVKISPALSLQVDEAIKVDKSSGTTQVATTTGSYTKAANIAKSLGAKSVLDYGAGLGLGSDAMSNVIKNVDSFEPNVDRWKGKNSPSFTSSADINKTYDAVVSLNVLNVVPKDIRDAIVKDIYNKLNPNGSAIVSTRGWTSDVNQAKNAVKGPEPKSAIIKRKEAGGTTDVYQKGFDGNELVDYVKEVLGDNVTVKKDNSFGKAGVVITKKSVALQLQTDTENQAASKIKDVYTSNTELSKIGTQKDYSNYVQSIFPDSKVKNVVYHSSNIDFDVFDKNKISSRKEGAPKGGDVGAFGRGIYFTPNSDYSKSYGKNLKSVVLDIKNPKIILNNEANDKLYQNKSIKDLWGDYDSVIYKVTDWKAVSESGVHSSIEEFNSIGLGKNNKPEVVDIAVDDINKIHILGSNQDVQDFQKWKKSGALQLQQEGDTRKSAKQTSKENNRTDEDAIASLIYNTNATKRAQESIEKTSLIQKISNLYKNIRLAGIENQASVRDLLRKNGAPGALADALLTTSRGYGAQATLAAEDISETVYGGLSEKKEIDIAGTLVSEVDLLNQVMNQRRVVAVQNMVQEKFDELQSMRAQMKKLKSKAKKVALQTKIDAAVEYLQDRKVLGKKYNPQTQTSTEYLQNYQVGSTVDAAGNKVSYNAGFASKQLDIISREYDGFNDLNERADKMFNAYRGLVKEKLDEGLISKETYDYYTKHDYVPISYIDKILKENDPDYARVLSKNPNQIRKSILGGGADGDILTDYKSIFEVYAVNHYKNVSTNKAAKGLANFAEAVDNNGEVELARPILDDEGIVKIDKEGNPVYRTPPEGKSYIYFYEDGQKKALLASDNIANEWYAKYAQSNELNIISNLALAGVAQKLFTGKNPGFGIFQMIALDPITAAVSTDVFSKSMPIAYAQIALGGKDTVGWKGSIEEVIGRGDKYRLAAKWGAFTEMNAGRELETSITKFSNDESTGNAYEKILKNVNNFTNKPIETLDKLMDATGLGKVSDVTEKATRLIIFDRARKIFTDKFVKDNDRQPNKSELDNIYTMSAAEARRSSDFSRGGSIIKPASRLLIYFNSTVQTNVSVINQAKKNPARFAYQIGEMLTLGGLVTAYSAGLMSAPWETDEEKKKKKASYKSLSEYQKLNYLNIYIGGDVPERQFLKVPIPPFFKNFWVSSMMAFENKYNKGMYTANDYVASAASANPFGSIADMPSKIPPSLNALAAYNNIDIFTKKNIVQDEADLPDNLEGAMDESISIFYKKMGEKTGLSPARTQAAMKKIIGEPERNPMIYIPKIAFESAMELATGAPLSIKNKFEQDWKGTLLNSLSLQKRVFAGTPKYYQTMVEGDLREISFLQSKAYSSLMSSDSKSFDEYQSKINEKKNAIVEYLKPIKESNPSMYDRMVKETESPMGGIKMDLTKSMSESTKRNYIKDNYDKNIYQAYIINDPKLRAMYIYDQVQNMSKEDKAHYFVILYNLGIANETNATGLEYNKLKKAN